MSDHSFTEKWRWDLQSGIPGVQLVEVEHPLEVYVGSSDLGRPRLQIRSSDTPKMPQLSDLILVDQQYSHGVHTFTMTLVDDTYLSVFMVLAADMITRTRSAQNETQALEQAATILEQWQRLLKRRPVRRLTIDELRGLVGELWLVLNHFNRGRSLHESVLGWQGPLGLPQDFWYADSGFHEAKSVGPSATNVKITSALQLDEADMELLVLRVPQAAAETAHAVSLLALVEHATATLTAEAQTDSELLERLKHLGVDLEDTFYAETFFIVDSITSYTVTADFPAIRASQLPPGFSRVTYALAISALETFKSGVPLTTLTKTQD